MTADELHELRQRIATADALTRQREQWQKLTKYLADAGSRASDRESLFRKLVVDMGIGLEAREVAPALQDALAAIAEARTAACDKLLAAL